MSKHRKAVIQKLRQEGIFLYDDHKLVSRRDFLGAGILNFTAVMSAPTIFSLLKSTPALAGCADTAVAPVLPAFLEVRLAGGAAMYKIKMPTLANGDPLPNYSLLGMGNAAYASNKAQPLLQASFGTYLDIQRGFFRGFNRFDKPEGAARSAVTTAQAKSAVFNVPVQSGDDSANNAYSLRGVLSMMGSGKGAYLPQLSTGGEHRQLSVAPDEPPAPLLVEGLPSILRALEPPGPLGVQFSRAERGALFDLLKELGLRRTAEMAERGVTNASSLTHLVNCTASSNAETSRANPPAIDPRSDTRLQEIWGFAANTSVNADSVKLCSIIVSLAKGHSGSASMTFGGYDYHTGEPTSGRTKREQAGTFIAQALETFAYLNAKAVIYLTSDGATYHDALDNPEESIAPGQTQPGAPVRGDRGEGGQAVVFLHDPAGRPTLVANDGSPLKDQVGYYTTGQAAARDFIAGWGTERASMAVLRNVAQFAGPSAVARFNQLFPGYFSNAELQKVVKLPLG